MRVGGDDGLLTKVDRVVDPISTETDLVLFPDRVSTTRRAEPKRALAAAVRTECEFYVRIHSCSPAGRTHSSSNILPPLGQAKVAPS